jgi:hypothetical protein
MGKKLNDEVVVAKNAITDEELVKAMEICANWKGQKDCDNCPIGIDRCCENQNIFAIYALDLIRRLQYEKKDMHQDLIQAEKYAEKLSIENARQKTEIERLTEYNANLNGMCLEFIDKNAELQKQVDEFPLYKEYPNRIIVSRVLVLAKTLDDWDKSKKDIAKPIVKDKIAKFAERAKYLIEERSGISGCDLEDVSVNGQIVVEVLDEICKEFTGDKNAKNE